MITTRFFSLFVLFSTALAAPTISLSYGAFQGFTEGNLTKFLGVTFARAGRFEVPKAPGLLHGVQNATSFGPACPQQALSPPPSPIVAATYPSISEDCLALDIIKPSTLNATSKLPVFVWLYGGTLAGLRQLNLYEALADR